MLLHGIQTQQHEKNLTCQSEENITQQLEMNKSHHTDFNRRLNGMFTVSTFLIHSPRLSL